MYISVRLIAGYRSANLPPTYLKCIQISNTNIYSNMKISVRLIQSIGLLTVLLLTLSVFRFLTRILNKYSQYDISVRLIHSKYRSANLSPTYLKCIQISNTNTYSNKYISVRLIAGYRSANISPNYLKCIQISNTNIYSNMKISVRLIQSIGLLTFLLLSLKCIQISNTNTYSNMYISVRLIQRIGLPTFLLLTLSVFRFLTRILTPICIFQCD